MLPGLEVAGIVAGCDLKKGFRTVRAHARGTARQGERLSGLFREQVAGVVAGCNPKKRDGEQYARARVRSH